MTRLTLPSGASTRPGEPERADDERHADAARRLHRATCTRAAAAAPRPASISPMPTGNAAARHALLISSAGVTIIASSRGVVQHARHDQREERERRGERQRVEQRAAARADAADERRHAHVLAVPQRDHRAEHRQPQEQDRRELVRPDQRAVEHVARHHAREQHDDLGQHQRRGHTLDHERDRAIERAGDAAQRIGRPCGTTRARRSSARPCPCVSTRGAGARPGRAVACRPCQASLPTACSSSAQASLPKRFFHSS